MLGVEEKAYSLYGEEENNPLLCLKKNQRSAANPALQWGFLKTSQKRWLSKLILKESRSYPCHSRGLEEGKGTVYFPSAKATVKEKIVQLEKCNYFTMIEE